MKMKASMLAVAISAGTALTAGHAAAQAHFPGYPMPDQQAQTDLAIPPANNGSSGQSSGSSGLNVEAGIDQAAPAPAADRPKPAMQGDVTYLCGGVGEEETAYVKSAARGYDLMLTFASQDGSYLANVDVAVRGPDGKPVLQVKCDAPILLVELPRSGTYRITAEAAGHRIERSARVRAARGKGATLAGLTLVWPQQVADAPAVRDRATGGGSNPGQSGK
ncbi:hypothetical protein [Noviherbaspirillum galbum]|uniref:Carboxypeptidase regulatory-like domain-containing protein n=1 Tax=Noviherbaspirillum galbum TaxID=2709383 RepID=A0A6B3SI62_9BURK|nr:hypothetical protein [Noviherbaspirillum galbum]NEX60350.1 hypothetical protein [Noviherbaspirillum galbum]